MHDQRATFDFGVFIKLKRFGIRLADPVIHALQSAVVGVALLSIACGSVRDSGLVRPQFDLVTGSSTGALIAVYAFVGTEESYAEAFRVFCDFPVGVFPRLSPVSYWITRAGLFDYEPLARTSEVSLGSARSRRSRGEPTSTG